MSKIDAWRRAQEIEESIKFSIDHLTLGLTEYVGTNPRSITFRLTYTGDVPSDDFGRYIAQAAHIRRDALLATVRAIAEQNTENARLAARDEANEVLQETSVTA